MAIGALNQLFIRGSYTQIKFKVLSGKSPFFVLIPILYFPFNLC